MATRFTDDIIHNTDNNDFIVRNRYPLLPQIFAGFLLVFIIIYFTATLLSGARADFIFSSVLLVAVGAPAWFTIVLTQRNRDLVLATEFQNAMLASAAQLSTRFCLITKRDGTIVYIDPGFQKTFPQFMQSDSRTIDGLLLAAGITRDLYKQVFQSFEEQKNDRLILPFTTAKGAPMPMVVTIDVLPRPKGYFLFRGRDYVEKRNSAPSAEAGSLTHFMEEAFQRLPEGVVIVNDDYTVLHVNALAEQWLGYAPGEIVASQLRLEQICHQYEGNPVHMTISHDFEGRLTLLRKDRSLVTFSAYQARLGSGNGLCIALFPEGDVKKNTSEPVTSTADLTHFVASSPIAVARINAHGVVTECNAPLRDLIRSKKGESGWPFLEIIKEEGRVEVGTALEQLRSGLPAPAKPLDVVLATDEVRTASLYLSAMDSASEIMAQIIDTTEQKNLEQRFAHSQKMQAVGQLAGGVAHDFNNLLTAMIGFCDLLLIRHPAGDQSFADIMQVKQNANRAANLVRQLLAFSRRQTLLPKMLDITDVLAELSNLIRRLIGENIELKVIHGRDLGAVKADQGQLEQVFINLAVNARDAMINGGRLTVQTSHVTIDRKHPISRNLIPPLEDEAIVDGDYVLVEVIDNGTGIPRSLLQKIFEPFFSTKEVGSGTGLGLATVYGIVKQTGGYIYVSSKEGAGTNFSLFFKRYRHEETKAVPEQVQNTISDDLTGKGTVLLVEDETPVRTFAARALRNKGYTVLEADCGENAVEVMEAQGSEVDVIISDVIMPGMNGPTMIETIAPKFPHVKVIFISGYAEDIFVKNYGSEREFNFLPKPFTLKQLASKVKEVMAK